MQENFRKSTPVSKSAVTNIAVEETRFVQQQAVLSTPIAPSTTNLEVVVEQPVTVADSVPVAAALPLVDMWKAAQVVFVAFRLSVPSCWKF